MMLFVPEFQEPYVVAMAPLIRLNAAMPARPMNVVSNAYSMRSWPCSSKKIRRRKPSTWGPEESRADARGPPDSKRQGLAGSRGRRAGYARRHGVVPAVQGASESRGANDGDEADESRE